MSNRKIESSILDANGQPIEIGQNIYIFGQPGKVIFEHGAYAIHFEDSINWQLFEDMISEKTGCDNRPHFSYNDYCVSFWELFDNYNCEENCCDVVYGYFTNTQDIYDYIMTAYQHDSVELNDLFFDLDVKDIPQKDLLVLYQQLQHDINGDQVVRLLDLKRIEVEDHSEVCGTLVDLIPNDGTYDAPYTGKYAEFLKSFNGKELNTGLCRLDEVYEEDGISGGEDFDFLF